MLSELERLVLRAISDPGSFLPRGDDYTESIPHWGMRAVLVALDNAGLMITDKVRIDVLTGQVAERDATIQRVRDEAATMRDEAIKTLALDPVEDGVSAGERYEAEVQRYVAARVLIVLEGDPQSGGDPADDGSQTDG